MGFLRVRVEVEWDTAGSKSALRPAEAQTASAAATSDLAAEEVTAGLAVGGGGPPSVWDMVVEEGSAVDDDFELPPAI